MGEKEIKAAQIKKMEAAYTGIGTEKSLAETERSTVNNALNDICIWKGTVYEIIKAQELKKKYDAWIGGGAGSISTCMTNISCTISAWRGRIAEIQIEENLRKILPPEDRGEE